MLSYLAFTDNSDEEYEDNSVDVNTNNNLLSKSNKNKPQNKKNNNVTNLGDQPQLFGASNDTNENLKLLNNISNITKRDGESENFLKMVNNKSDVIVEMDIVDGGPSRNHNEDLNIRFSKDDNNEDGSLIEIRNKKSKDEVDSRGNKNLYASKKNVAEGMMDIALLTANASQLRFLFTYNTESKTFYVSVGLILVSLVLQVAVGIALIFKRQMKNKGKRNHVDRTNDLLVGGVFLVTVINVFAATFTMTESPKTGPPS